MTEDVFRQPSKEGYQLPLPDIYPSNVKQAMTVTPRADKNQISIVKEIPSALEKIPST